MSQTEGAESVDEPRFEYGDEYDDEDQLGEVGEESDEYDVDDQVRRLSGGYVTGG